MTSQVSIKLSPNAGAFTALRAIVDGNNTVVDTMGGAGSWSGKVSTSVRIEAVGVAGSTFDCKVTGGRFNHEIKHTLGSNGRFNETL